MNLLRWIARQHWIRRGLRNRMLLRFAPPERLPGTPFREPFYGYTYPGNTDTYIDWNVYYFGAYEREILELMGDILRARPGSVFVDVGANVGHHSLYAARFATVVHAFEPFAQVREHLLEKLTVNGIEHVVVHDVGLGDANICLPFFSPSGANQGTGSFVAGHSRTNSQTSSLPLIRGDDFAAGLDRIDLIKIDVEGFERTVLDGLRGSLARLRPCVLFEYSDTTRRSVPTPGELATLFPADYSLFDIATRVVRLFFFESPGYRLKPLVNAPAVTNEVLAVPNERVAKLRLRGS